MPKKQSHTPDNCPINDRVNENYEFIKQMLVKIDNRLDKLNGKVASHERNWGGQEVINKQVENIQKGLNENDKLTSGINGRILGISATVTMISGLVIFLITKAFGD